MAPETSRCNVSLQTALCATEAEMAQKCLGMYLLINFVPFRKVGEQDMESILRCLYLFSLLAASFFI